MNREAATADPVDGWTAPGGETGLEEPMWQLGLNTGPESYPERPDHSDCMYYLRTGFCGFGDRCRFNHPPDSAGIGAMKGSGEYPDRMDQPVCQYYMRTGTCKYGASCKYHHPRRGGGSAAPVNLNIYGYPLRQGEKECTYYVKTGECKFGLTCKFDHPQPAGFQVAGAGASPAPVPAMYPSFQSPSVQPSQQYGVVSGNWPLGRPAMLPGSYIPGAYGPMMFSPGMVTVPGWTPYPAPVGLASPSSQPIYGASPVYGITQLSPSASAYGGQYLPGPSSNSQKGNAYPERHGQPECQHYMRTGNCKYGSSCKYHHPVEWNGPRTNSDGLPLHINGVLMGSISHSPSASSFTEMPVGFSASDLKPELVSGSSKDALPTQVSSTNTSRAPAVAHSILQQHGSSSAVDTGQGGEVLSSS